MPGKFQVYKDKAGEYRFRLRNDEGSIVLASEAYKQYDGVMNGVKSVKKNCGAHVEDTTVGQKLANPKYSVFLGTDKGYKYTLIAPNGEPIGFEAEHPNKSDVMAVIEEVKKCGDATIEDLTGHVAAVAPAPVAAAAAAPAAVAAAPVAAAPVAATAGVSETMIELMDMGPALEVRDPREYYGVHHLGLKTDDFQAQYQSLKEKGAEFLGEPFEPKKGIQLVFLRDPNGAIIELSQRDPEVFEEAIAKGTVDW